MAHANDVSVDRNDETQTAILVSTTGRTLTIQRSSDPDRVRFDVLENGEVIDDNNRSLQLAINAALRLLTAEPTEEPEVPTLSTADIIALDGLLREFVGKKVLIHRGNHMDDTGKLTKIDVGSDKYGRPSVYFTLKGQEKELHIAERLESSIRQKCCLQVAFMYGAFVRTAGDQHQQHLLMHVHSAH